MKIEVLIQGDPDIKPITRIFDYDKPTLLQTTQLIKKRLSNNMLLNISDTLGLFVAYIVTMLEENKDNEIQEHLPKLLASHQVMIGVPESMRKLTFKIPINGAVKEMSITEPIHINQYILQEKSTQEMIN